ncbi:MAG TPA: TonB-dependent receptor [Candidatus Koribacter sp.]|jgi:hypothetical protein
MKRLISVFLLVLFILCSTFALAQGYLSSINGTVTDKTGAVIRGAKVTVTNVAKGISQTFKTNETGAYSAPSLEPGDYTVTAEATGFGVLTKEDLHLEVAHVLRLDFQLLPGAAKETVAVREEAALVNTSNAILESTFTNEQINQLPLQGRDFQNLVVLNPGVERRPGGGFLSISSNGNRVEDNNFIVDGIDDNDAYYGTTVINAEGVQGTPATHLPIDAIQEFNVQSSPEAEYGWKPGAIVNIGIKSGTNTLHGTSYYFGRNSALDARNYFNPAPDPVSALRLHQFGGSIGGPIKKDKLFFFANYEGVRDVVGNPLQLNTPVTVPTGDPTVSIPDAVAACTADGTCNDLSLSLLKYFPTNRGTANASDPTLQNFDFNNTNREDNGIVKVDYNINEHNNASFRYFIGDSVQVEEEHNVLNPAWLDSASTRAQVIGASYNWLPTANLVTQWRFGFNRFSQQIFTVDHSTNPTAYGINTGVTDPLDFGFPEIAITGFNRLGGSSSWPLFTTPNLTYQLTENTTWTHGNHSFKFGGEFRTGSTDNLRDLDGKGYVAFRGLEQFVTGDYRYGYIKSGNTHRVVSQKSFGGYAQDDWRIVPRVTITGGLRYDVSLPISEANDLLANFDPAVGIQQVGSQISSPYNTDLNNFAPRLGVAWDVFGTGKTVLRAGTGIIYEIPHISMFISQNSADALGLATIPSGANGISVAGGKITTADLKVSDLNWSSAGPIFGDIPSTKLTCDSDTPCSILGVDKNIKTPYSLSWNVNLEQQLTQNMALQIAYVGNHGVKLYSIRNINQNQWYYDWTANGMGDPYDDTDGQSGRPFTNPALCGNNCFPYLADVEMLQNKDSSIYHGLQVTLRQHSYKGIDFVAGYTWAHSIDQYGSNRSYDWEDPNNGLLERGDASSDIRHRFTLAFTYQVPKFEHYDKALGGWTFNTILNFETGRPIDLYDGDSAFSGAYTGNDRWNIYGDPSNLKWGLAGIPFIPKYDDNGNVSAAWTKTCAPYAPGLLPGIDPGTDYPTTSDYAGGCYAQNGTVLVPAQWGQFGNMRRNMFRGPGYQNVDMSLAKAFKLNERFSLQLRGEFFNIFNHTNFAGLSANLESGAVGIPAYTPDVAESNPVVGSGGSRHIQLGAKVVF